MTELSERAQEKVRTIGSLPNTLVTYDDFEYSVKATTEQLGDRKTFRSITTVITVLGVKIPSIGLQQSMWRPNKQLRLKDICPPLGNEKIWFKQVRI